MFIKLDGGVCNLCNYESDIFFQYAEKVHYSSLKSDSLKRTYPVLFYHRSSGLFSISKLMDCTSVHANNMRSAMA